MFSLQWHSFAYSIVVEQTGLTNVALLTRDKRERFARSSNIPPFAKAQKMEHPGPGG
jgi:hypothetical protein